MTSRGKSGYQNFGPQTICNDCLSPLITASYYMVLKNITGEMWVLLDTPLLNPYRIAGVLLCAYSLCCFRLT